MSDGQYNAWQHGHVLHVALDLHGVICDHGAKTTHARPAHPASVLPLQRSPSARNIAPALAAAATTRRLFRSAPIMQMALP